MLKTQINYSNRLIMNFVDYDYMLCDILLSDIFYISFDCAKALLRED